MSLDTYANLQTEIASWAWRTNDTEFATAIPTMIDLAEAEMGRRIHTRRKVIRSDATVSAEFIDLPNDFESALAFTLTGTSPVTRLVYIDPEKALELNASGNQPSSGVPVYYSIVGDEFQFVPPPDSSYTAELTYRQKIPALTDSNTSNWVLASHPDLYLYGALKHAAPWLGDDERITVWGTLFESALQSLERDDVTNQFAGRLNARARSFG